MRKYVIKYPSQNFVYLYSEVSSLTSLVVFYRYVKGSHQLNVVSDYRGIVAMGGHCSIGVKVYRLM